MMRAASSQRASDGNDDPFALPDLPEDEEQDGVVQISLSNIPHRTMANINNNNNATTTDAPSVATTALASRVGSTVIGEPKDAFLRSITFQRGELLNENEEASSNNDVVVEDEEWGIEVSDQINLLANTPSSSSSGGGGGGMFSSFRNRNKKKRLYVDSVDGCICLSTIQPGDYLYSINGKRITAPNYNAQRAMDRMKECYENEGVLSVAVMNEDGDDVLIQATILKPKPNLTYEQLGIVVWFWGCLVIKSIDKTSIFYHSVLKSDDQILSVNDIICTTPEQFAEIVTELDKEIIIVVKRGRQRWNGKFG